jgi:hypothetical protein
VAGDVDLKPLITRAHAAGATDRKLRLFACACARLVESLLNDPRSRTAIEVAERFADGDETVERLADAGEAAEAAALDMFGDVFDAGSAAAVLAAQATCFPRAVRAARISANEAAAASAAMAQGGDAAGVAAGPHQVALLACVVGPRPLPTVDPAWIAWQAGAVPQFARAAYDDRRLPEGTLEPAQLAVLADALEDAGCADAGLLGHLRGPGPHCRGCWAVDLLLGKS